MFCLFRLVQLTSGLNIAFNWSIVVSVKEFAYNGSFLHQVRLAGSSY